MNLTIKHLAGYLPYGVHLMNEYGRWHNTTLNKGLSIYEMLEMKPILRPLSDLTKEIEINGEKFIPIDKINEYDETIMSYSLSFYTDCTLRLPYYVIKYLFEWHFDIYGLIENDLAIDINTLKL